MHTPTAAAVLRLIRAAEAVSDLSGSGVLSAAHDGHEPHSAQAVAAFDELESATESARAAVLNELTPRTATREPVQVPTMTADTIRRIVERRVKLAGGVL